MPTAASSDQKYRSLPCPNGCSLSAGRLDRRSAVSSSTSVTESPTECAASDSSAADPVNRPASAFSTAMPTLTASASTTVRTLSEDCSGMAGEDRLRFGTGQRMAVPGEHAAGTPLPGALDKPAGVDGYTAEVADETGDHRLGGRVVAGEEERERFGVLVQRAQPRNQQVVERLDQPGTRYQLGDHLAGRAAAEVDELVVHEVVGGVDDDLPGERPDQRDRRRELRPPGREHHEVRVAQLRRGDRGSARTERRDEVGQRVRAAGVGQQYPVAGGQPDARQGLRHLAGAQESDEHSSSPDGTVSSGE